MGKRIYKKKCSALKLARANAAAAEQKPDPGGGDAPVGGAAGGGVHVGGLVPPGNVAPRIGGIISFNNTRNFSLAL